MNEVKNIKKAFIIIGSVISVVLAAAGVYFLVTKYLDKHGKKNTVEIEFDGDNEPEIIYPDFKNAEN